MVSIPPARRRQLRTWTPAPGSDRLRAVDHAIGAEALVDLASNDYLNLARNPVLQQAAWDVIQEQGVGAAGSRLVTGSRPVHQQLEEALGQWLGWETVLLFPSGFQANLAAVTALADRHTTVLTDRLIHHSLLVGVQTSGAQLKRFAHNDLTDLQHKLESLRAKDPSKPLLVISESLFSMEGTSPNLDQLCALCERHDARLLVDEAHALGVLGPGGRGLAATVTNPDASTARPITMVSGTFGKAFGSGGAFLATDAAWGDILLQTSGAFRYSTALAPPLAAAALAALRLIQANPHWGERLVQAGEHWRDRIAEIGWPRPSGHGPILPLLVGDDQRSLDLQQLLEQNGILSIAIRPPTVPEGSARLRLVLHRQQSEDSLRVLLRCLNKTGITP